MVSLLHKQLPEMIAYAKKKEISEQIRVTTNGTLLDRFGEEWTSGSIGS